MPIVGVNGGGDEHPSPEQVTKSSDPSLWSVSRLCFTSEMRQRKALAQLCLFRRRRAGRFWFFFRQFYALASLLMHETLTTYCFCSDQSSADQT